MNGVTFGSKHSYRDWGLYLKSRPVISPPSPKTVYVDLPGSDGQLDLTEALTGEVKYDPRDVKCEFVVIAARQRWDSIYSDIMDYLHGQQMEFVTDEDNEYMYRGRFKVDEWNSDKKTATIEISGVVEPYKLERISSLDDWVWDTFNFETGIIRELKEIRIDGEKIVEIPGSRMSVIPTFIVTSDNKDGMSVTYKNKTYTLEDGKNIIPYISIDKEGISLQLSGSGTVSIDYRGGRL